MRVGVPREIKNHEYRVALTPAGVHELTRAGHEVLVEKGAGEGSSIPDDDMVAAGARIVGAADDVWADADLLLGYHDAVHVRTLQYVAGLADADLDRVVDRRWDPAVTLGVRLVSVADDDLQHAGQAAFVRGVVERG